MHAAIPLGFSLDLVDGWQDVTHELPVAAPFTLARADGFGVFQFSSAVYQAGRVPKAGVAELREMLASFGRDRGLGEPADVQFHDRDTSSVGGSFQKGDFIRVWYVSDGKSFVFASHTSGRSAPEEVEQCESMIRSLEFRKEESNHAAQTRSLTRPV